MTVAGADRAAYHRPMFHARQQRHRRTREIILVIVFGLAVGFILSLGLR
jgi:hypothetical protein